MNKSDLVRIISVKYEMNLDDAERAVSAFFDTISDGLKEGKRVELRGLGAFTARDYDGYLGRNPKTGEAVTVPPKRLPYFKPGKDLKEAANN